ncbi:MAG: RNase adapter RapZ, partial [Lachnospiraceae bacterium]|nr:RNase adapter RapZ [Lachnospiraceae bacterium]
MYKRFVIVTGISGAGKSTALRALEDLGYFCADNLPISLIKVLFQLVVNGNNEKMNKVALGIDIRSGGSINDLQEILDDLKASEYPFEILFIDADDEVIVRRYKETRRVHPLSDGKGAIEENITNERQQIGFLKERADLIIDTSDMLIKNLRRELRKHYADTDGSQKLSLTVMSFGFKYSIPADADMVFDARFLPNPYYIPELKKLSGNDPPVSDYVMGCEAAKAFVEKAADMIEYLAPRYIEEGKNLL